MNSHWQVIKHQFFTSKLLMLSLAIFLLPICAHADAISTVSAENVLVNIAKQVPSLMRLATALAYLVGTMFIIAGFVKLRHVGEMRTQMSHEHGWGGPSILIAIGVMLLYVPTSVQVGLSTFWSDPNPYGYLQQTDEWSQFINDCYLIVQLVGTIAFIRGLIILSRLSHHGGGHDTLGRGLTHVIGGILCINIYQFVQVVMNTLGIQT
jgi:intracellular multiplication protein IcmC